MEKTIFKIGDKVKIIDNKFDSINEIGDIGIITAISSFGFRVKVFGRENIGNWHFQNELELVTKQQQHETKNHNTAWIVEVKRNEYKCRYCGCMTTQPENECYAKNGEITLKND